MIFGTDLAIERREITNSGKNDGVTVKKRRIKSASVTEIEITTDAGAEKLGKPVGTYVTVERRFHRNLMMQTAECLP